MTDLSSKRVLLIGAESERGRVIAAALAEAGARLALVGSTNDPETAFAVQRLARKLQAQASQAIDATNEMAVRVMVRQVSKVLGGLDAVVFAADLGDATPLAVDLARRFADREFARLGLAGALIAAVPMETPAGLEEAPPSGAMLTVQRAEDEAAVAAQVVAALAAPSR